MHFHLSWIHRAVHLSNENNSSIRVFFQKENSCVLFDRMYLICFSSMYNNAKCLFFSEKCLMFTPFITVPFLKVFSRFIVFYVPAVRWVSCLHRLSSSLKKKSTAVYLIIESEHRAVLYMYVPFYLRFL